MAQSKTPKSKYHVEDLEDLDMRPVSVDVFEASAADLVHTDDNKIVSTTVTRKQLYDNPSFLFHMLTEVTAFKNWDALNVKALCNRGDATLPPHLKKYRQNIQVYDRRKSESHFVHEHILPPTQLMAAQVEKQLSNLLWDMLFEFNNLDDTEPFMGGSVPQARWTFTLKLKESNSSWKLFDDPGHDSYWDTDEDEGEQHSERAGSKQRDIYSSKNRQKMSAESTKKSNSNGKESHKIKDKLYSDTYKDEEDQYVKGYFPRKPHSTKHYQQMMAKSKF